MRLGVIAYLVRDYDEAVAWFTEKLGFTLVEDAPLTPAKRWVVVAPPDGSCSLLLAKAEGAAQEAAVGAQAGGRVLLFLYTDDFASSYAAMRAKGVKFLEPPRREAYGTVAVFEDLYGQKWDLIEPG
ncbi:MAG TPA: extradiol dioxygenase [Parvularcula sp.]|nr:extradiol dioxygenase [Parvularcula sp.]HBS32313.1 extradiol dioxygenase [Parvularcula sp.]HBS34109.1 extradiol dioxygenase [Parvularcula sp.]